ncbi:MAG: hypothetical protein AAFP81_20145, partial [Pseudomonadota bacterium]
DYGRATDLAVAGEYGEVNSDRATAYNQETGFVLGNSSEAAFVSENGSVQSGSETSYTRAGGYAADRELTATNAQGGMLAADVTYNAQEGADANVTCTNAAGETVACKN